MRLTLTFSGLFAAAMQGNLEDWIERQARSCLVDSVEEWIVGRQSPSLRDRFGPNAYSRYGFTRRTPKYEKAQKRVLGAAQPYASPRGLNFQRAALAIAKGAGDPRAIVRAARDLIHQFGTPMRVRIFQPGGHTVRAVGSRLIRVRLTLPGARNLNRGGAKSAVYQKELLDMSLAARRDERWIFLRCDQLMRERVWWVLNNHPATTVARA